MYKFLAAETALHSDLALPGPIPWRTAAVSCSPDGALSGGVKMGLGLTGKLGRAWVGVRVVVLTCCQLYCECRGGVGVAPLRVILPKYYLGSGMEDW